MCSSASFALSCLSLLPARILTMTLLAFLRNMSTRRFLMAKWLFSYTSHFGSRQRLTSTGTITLSRFISVSKRWQSWVRILSRLSVIKFYLLVETPSTYSSVAGGSPQHSKNLMPFCRSRSSSLLYSFKKANSSAVKFIAFSFLAVSSSYELKWGVPLRGSFSRTVRFGFDSDLSVKSRLIVSSSSFRGSPSPGVALPRTLIR